MVASRTALRTWALVAGVLLAIAACMSWVSETRAALPDGRAYELVSPPEKSGADVIAQSYKTFAATDGNGVAWPATGAFAGALGTSVDVQYLSRRDGRAGTSGWRTHSINPAGGSQKFEALITINVPTFEAAFTEDLRAGVYKAWRPLTDAPNVEGVSNLYRLRNLDERAPEVELVTGSASPLAAMPNELRWLFQNAIDGASRDLRHVFFQSPWNLTGDGAFSFTGDLYEFAEGVGVRRVGRIPIAPATTCDEVARPECVDASAEAGITAGLLFGNSMHSSEVISDDGSRIVFTVTAGDMAGALFLREDGARTFHVNASEKTTPESAQAAVAWGISRDGSRVFFTTSEGLVDGDDVGNDLYMYDRTAPEGSRLTRLSVNARGDSCDAEGVVGASSAGDVVYFLCTGQLIEGEGGQTALYRWQEGGTFAYLGRFDSIGLAQRNTPRTQWPFPKLSRASRVTPDGRFVLFMAFRDDGFVGVGGFSGYEHEDLRQWYLYSAPSRRLVCVSCNPRSRAATSDALTDVKVDVSATLHTQHLSHALSDDGRRVFFSSPEALVAEDSNGRWDAYEYDVPSGRLHLISSGTDPANSYFVQASANGDDVFFATREQLVGWDIDKSYDLYDARVGGGFPEPVPAAQACAGEACRAPVTASPTVAGGVSTQFRGAGDATPRLRRHKQQRCRRGKVLKRVRGRRKCVKRRARKAVRRHVMDERSGK